MQPEKKDQPENFEKPPAQHPMDQEKKDAAKMGQKDRPEEFQKQKPMEQTHKGAQDKPGTRKPDKQAHVDQEPARAPSKK